MVSRRDCTRDPRGRGSWRTVLPGPLQRRRRAILIRTPCDHQAVMHDDPQTREELDAHFGPDGPVVVARRFFEALYRDRSFRAAYEVMTPGLRRDRTDALGRVERGVIRPSRRSIARNWRQGLRRLGQITPSGPRLRTRASRTSARPTRSSTWTCTATQADHGRSASTRRSSCSSRGPPGRP